MVNKRWYFKTNYEDYNVLYEDEKYILVQNDNTKDYSFGLKGDFGTLCGFPINQRCLYKEECINRLHSFISIDEKYGDINKTKAVYENMIKALEVNNEKED